MCAIVDANVRDEVFGGASSEAGKFFLDWLRRPNGGLLALGGKLRQELSGLENFRRIYDLLRLNGRIVDIDDSVVDAETAVLEARRICRSNDAHVLALARVSGARLLYTNDQSLQDDFGDPRIVANPRGRVYTTRLRSDVRPTHRELLERADLCAR